MLHWISNIFLHLQIKLLVSGTKSMGYLLIDSEMDHFRQWCVLGEVLEDMYRYRDRSGRRKQWSRMGGLVIYVAEIIMTEISLVTRWIRLYEYKFKNIVSHSCETSANCNSAYTKILWANVAHCSSHPSSKGDAEVVVQQAQLQSGIMCWGKGVIFYIVSEWIKVS